MMRDSSDDILLAPIRSAIRKALEKGLEKDDTATWLPTRVVDTDRYIRFRTDWIESPRTGSTHEAGDSESPETGPTLFRATAAGWEYAHQLTSVATFSIDQLTQNSETVPGEVEELAKQFRRVECLSVLNEIRDRNLDRLQEATVDGVGAAVAGLNLPGSSPPDRLACRILASHDLVTMTRSRNLVDDGFCVGPTLPADCQGIVFPTVGGPLVERIGDDVTYDVRVLPDAGVHTRRLHVSLIQQFFITRPHRAYVLVNPAVARKAKFIAIGIMRRTGDDW